MRINLFRGKDENGNWHEGYLTNTSSGVCITKLEIKPPTQLDPLGNIVRVYYQVIPETVGQFTGLIDKNGNSIFDNGQLLRIKGIIGENGEYKYDCIYKTEPLTYRGLELSFVRLFSETPDDVTNSYPISVTFNIENGLSNDYINQNYNNIAIKETYGENYFSGKRWLEHHYTNDIEVIDNS